VLSGWGEVLEANSADVQLNAEAWIVWALTVQAFFAVLTYPAGLLSLGVWWLWRVGIATAAETVFLQAPLAAAAGFAQWFVVFPKLFAAGPNRSLEPTSIGKPPSAAQLQRSLCRSGLEVMTFRMTPPDPAEFRRAWLVLPPLLPLALAGIGWSAEIGGRSWNVYGDAILMFFLFAAALLAAVLACFVSVVLGSLELKRFPSLRTPGNFVCMAIAVAFLVMVFVGGTYAMRH